MDDTIIRELDQVEQSILEALQKVNPNLEEEDAKRRIIEVSDTVKRTPEIGLLLVRLAADGRVDARPKVQLALLSLNTLSFGPVRFWSRMLTGPAGWIVGPVSFFNDVVAGFYGVFRLAQVLEETDPDVIAECWEGEEDGLDEFLERLSGFNQWAKDKKMDRVFKVLSWIP